MVIDNGNTIHCIPFWVDRIQKWQSMLLPMHISGTIRGITNVMIRVHQRNVRRNRKILKMVQSQMAQTPHPTESDREKNKKKIIIELANNDLKEKKKYPKSLANLHLHRKRPQQAYPILAIPGLPKPPPTEIVKSEIFRVVAMSSDT